MSRSPYRTIGLASFEIAMEVYDFIVYLCSVK